MRILLTGVALLAATACAPTVPDSGAGVGFDNYASYEQKRAQREAELAGTSQPSGQVISPEVVTTAPITTITASGEPISAIETQAEAPLPEVSVNNPGISDEQNFDAVSNRESIQSDAARIEANKQAYQVVEPTALPTRPSNAGPSIVEFALSTSNNVGQSVHSRSIIMAESRSARNCAKYTSADLAQEAFLKAGGPANDRMGLDPDGDGFACSWDPSPFRLAVKN